MEYLNSPCKLHDFIPRVGLGLPWPAWVRFNRLQTDVWRFWSYMHKWELVPSYNCECGAHEQTADPIISVDHAPRTKRTS